MPRRESTKVIIISLLANVSVALAKLAGALFTGSASLLAEAVHSFSDCGNQALLLYAQRASALPATKQYPLGRGRETFFWAFIVALLLFSMGGVFNIYEGLHKIKHAGPVSYPYVGMGILGFVIIMEAVSFITGLHAIRRLGFKGNLRQWLRQTPRADLLVIFLENLAALIGLVIALAAFLATWLTNNSVYDGVGSLCIGVLLIITAFVLAREVKSLLIGEAPHKDYAAAITEILAFILPSARLLDVVALQQGIESVLLCYKIKPGFGEDIATLIKKTNEFEAEVQRRHPEVKWQFVEFDSRADVE